MQEWMIAMLVISVLLVIRDMAKTILAGNMPDMQEILPLYESHPQKEKVERYAASFQKLADTFYGMPYRKEYCRFSRKGTRRCNLTYWRWAWDEAKHKSKRNIL